MKVKRLSLLLFVLILFMSSLVFANPWNGKVILQGFWWDYHNNNYQSNWSTYLADLAPRLRDMGVDAVWIPPTPKNANATGSVGYTPFDHYDLGDKYQKGSTGTRFGTKDQYLRAVAVLHANGIDVIQDVVYNHTYGADIQDPTAWDDKWKFFRYVSYKTPNDTTYARRQGRFSKNWQNFHSSPGHVCNTGDWCSAYWGPDNCFYSGAYGQAGVSGSIFNPTQTADHLRIGMRNWSVWMKKQTGVDGFRLDAVKHFPQWATKDFVWNMANNAGWASGGSTMLTIGEYVGSKSELDGWVDAVNNADGYSDVVGTFDFSLRQEVKNMVSGSGYYDIGAIAGAQQDRRSRTVPFVNNHDTFRPILSGTGTYSGWDSGNELGGGHIDPFDGRVQAAYAVSMAVDGSPQIFFEDLFDIGGTGLRWTHDPRNATQLPVRDYLANLIWCHQKMNFKDGAYMVRWQAQDLLIIERSAKAIIGVTDSWTNWQSATVQTNFGANVRLHDYSGANTTDIWTDGTGKATIWVPPCNGSNIRRGYTVWGPVGISGGFSPAIRTTTQEWEMANDLGDSHASSLGQGGALPANSAALRTAGKIYSAASKTVTLTLSPENISKRLELRLYSGTTVVASANGYGNLTVTYTPTTNGWYTIKVKNYYTTNPSQKVWIKATYTGPQVLNSGGTLADDKDSETAQAPDMAQLSGQGYTTTTLAPIFPNPFNPSATISFSVPTATEASLIVYNTAGQRVVTLLDDTIEAGAHEFEFDGAGYSSGVYFVRLVTPTFNGVQRMTLLK